MTRAASSAWLRRDGNVALLAVGFLARLPLGMGAVLPLLAPPRPHASAGGE